MRAAPLGPPAAFVCRRAAGMPAAAAAVTPPPLGCGCRRAAVANGWMRAVMRAALAAVGGGRRQEAGRQGETKKAPAAGGWLGPLLQLRMNQANGRPTTHHRQHLIGHSLDGRWLPRAALAAKGRHPLILASHAGCLRGGRMFPDRLRDAGPWSTMCDDKPHCHIRHKRHLHRNATGACVEIAFDSLC